MPFTAAEIARHLKGEVVGDGALALTGFAPADRAQPGDLTFAENESYFARAEASAASAILVGGALTSQKKVLIRVANPRIAFAKVLPLFFPEPAFPPGIHASAIVAASAKVDPTAHIGSHCIVGENARIGPRVVLEGLDYVGAEAKLGEDTRVFPNVNIYARSEIGARVRIHSGTVIGSDGFGYVFDQGAHRKVPQIGNVIVCDDVEIGSNVSIDRGALGPTTIGKGTKIDNLVMIAHNVTIGEHCLLISQVGIAGSTRMGNYVTLAGQVGLAGHLKLGDRVTVGAQSGVMTDVPDGEMYLGTPAVADKQAKRQYIGIHQLPELIRRVKELERRLAKKDEK
jgi:UDP-3-O-[3-hydroxymyristoyl] glucosamine N-acyltransferase